MGTSTASYTARPGRLATEGIDFYASQAERRLGASPRARSLTRLALGHLWKPVGSGEMPLAEVRFLCDHLFVGNEGRAAAERIDRRVDRLPGLDGLHLLTGVVDGQRGRWNSTSGA